MKSKTIQFRLSEEEYDKVKKCADNNDLTLSDAIRWIIADAVLEANRTNGVPPKKTPLQ